MSISDVAADLDAAADMIDAGTAILSRVVAAWDEAISVAAAATAGSSQPEIVQALALLTQARQNLASILQTARSAKDSAHAYRVHLAGGGSPSTAAMTPPTTSTPPLNPVPSPTVVNRHGDRYPEDALPYSDDLPARVRRGQRNSPMTGIVEVGGRFLGEISATTTDIWTEEVARRTQRLGLTDPTVRVLYNHVEMKTVAMMIRSGATHARIVINHAPCGSEPRAGKGCDAYLPEFIPAGSTLTVLGTDRNGNPFRRDYTGKASE
ncbi:DddA-like double-stranded DNA deaminase toxin [Actinokineospora sp. 24-640]